MRIIKRDGREETYDILKIEKAIKKANSEVERNKRLELEEIVQIAQKITDFYQENNIIPSVENVQDKVELGLMEHGKFEVAQAYIRYRFKHEQIRRKNTTDDKILSLIELQNEEVKQENSNKNPTIVSTQRDYMAGEVSKDLTRRFLLPEDISKAHDEGIIHFHDADYFAQHMYNCCLVNIGDMLENGTVISGTYIEKPHSFATACNVMTQIMAQVASCQYGGQSVTLSHLAQFVDISRQKLRQEVKEEFRAIGYDTYNDESVNRATEIRLKREIARGVQTIQYQINTLQTTNGQAPFATVFMYLGEVEEGQLRHDLAMIIEEMLEQRYVGVKNEKGVYITPAFPKLIYVLEDCNINKDSEYYYLTKKAAKCTAKRMVPDYISAKVMKDIKGYVFPAMGCRSFLSPWQAQPDKFYGRFNKGVVTINLIDVACSAYGDNYEKDMESFWEIFEDRLELCHRALLKRYERLKGTPSDVAPILWQNGAIARLKKGETIDKLLEGGYSTISLGYAGLWECVYELIGKKLTEPEGEALGLEIMEYMNKKCDDWNEELNLGFGIYGSPIESTTYKFAKCLQTRFGVIPHVTDKNYVTNSYHVHVTEEIDAFSKLGLESKFQRLSTGGAISYIEIPNMENNLEGIMTVLKFIYNNIMYAELNTKSDYCQKCGWDREILIVEDNGKLVWECPNCHNRDQSTMNVARRTCGYIGSNYWNQGRTEEIKERYIHLGNGK